MSFWGIWSSKSLKHMIKVPTISVLQTTLGINSLYALPPDVLEVVEYPNTYAIGGEIGFSAPNTLHFPGFSAIPEHRIRSTIQEKMSLYMS